MRVVLQHVLSAVVAFALLGGALAPLPARADDAAALLAKHRAYVGWQLGDGSVPGLQLTREFRTSKGKLTQRATEIRAGMLLRRDYSDAKTGLTDSLGFTGHVFWETNYNGFVTPIVGTGASFQLAVDVLLSEGTSELPGTLHGTGTVDGKTYPIVRVAMGGATPIDLYVDPQTGAYVRAVVDPGGSEETSYTIASYMTIAPGKRMIGSFRIGDGGGIFTYTKSHIDPAVTAAELHPPAPQARWAFTNDRPFKIQVTGDRIYVDATVNGVLGTFILDTGDSGITLTDQFADRAKVASITDSSAWGIGGVFKTRTRRAKTIEIGGNTLSNTIVQTYNNQYPRKSDRVNPDGLIGFDLLAGAMVTLDTANQTMQIQNPATASLNTSAGLPLLVELSSDTPSVPVTLDHKVTIEATFDTGDPSLIIFSADLLDHGLTILTGRAIVGGMGGTELMRCGQIDSINLGPIVYQTPVACASHEFSKHAGLIGLDFLRHFNFIFDYPQSIIVMTPHKQ